MALAPPRASRHCLQCPEQRQQRDLEGEVEAQGRNGHGRRGNPSVVTTDSCSSKTSKLVWRSQRPQQGAHGNVCAGWWETRFPVTAWRDGTGGDTGPAEQGGEPFAGCVAPRERLLTRAAQLTSVSREGSFRRWKRGEPQGRMQDATSLQAGRWRKPSRW
jgi:hypothetical protein